MNSAISSDTVNDPYVTILGVTGARMYHRMEALAEKANLEVGRLRSELKHARMEAASPQQSRADKEASRTAGRRDAISEAIDYFQQPRRSSRSYSGLAVARLLQSWLDDEDKEEAARPLMPYHEPKEKGARNA